MKSPKIRQEQLVKLLMAVLPCSYKEAQAAARWLLKQSLELQTWAKEQSKSRYFTLKKRSPEIDQSLLSIAADLIVACKIKDAFMKKYRKNKIFTSDDVILSDLFESNEFVSPRKRIAKKEAYLQQHKAQIMKWRELGISYRQIASCLIMPDTQTISSEKIRKFINAQRSL